MSGGDHLPEHWIQKLCVLLSIPGWLDGRFPRQVGRFFSAWQKAEGGTAEWDPLNTTDHIKDAWGNWQGIDYNGIHVANYTTPFHGVVATAATLLESSQFTGIVADLRVIGGGSTLTAEEIVRRNEAEIREWGTDPATILSVLASTP